MKVVLMVRKVDKRPPKRWIRLEKTLAGWEPQKMHKQRGKGGGEKKGKRREREAHSFPPMTFGSGGFSEKNVFHCSIFEFVAMSHLR
jgi:hypothetical protein